jgi:hypothetical protein
MIEIKLFTLVAIAVLAVALFLYMSPFAACRNCPGKRCRRCRGLGRYQRRGSRTGAQPRRRHPRRARARPRRTPIIFEEAPMTILTILIPAVVAVGLAVLAAVLHRTGGLWLVQSPATPRHDETQPDASRATLDAPGAVQRRAIEAPRTRLVRLHPEPGRLKKQG